MPIFCSKRISGKYQTTNKSGIKVKYILSLFDIYTVLQPDEACLFCDDCFVFESFAQVHEDVARGLITDKIYTDIPQGCQIS